MNQVNPCRTVIAMACVASLVSLPGAAIAVDSPAPPLIKADAPPSQRVKRVEAGVESEDAPSGGVSVTVIDHSPQAKFAAEELRTVVQARATAGKWRITLRLATGDAAREIRPEGFHIEKTSRNAAQRIDILAADPAGLMYGGLEVAEIIRTLGVERVKNDRQNPYLTMRGTKFNIPLDVRTPSYTDVCDAAQVNIPEMWSFDFWREYIDTLARYRYNYVSLWNLHPFPSLVKVPEYPDVALNDVWRSRVKWRENYPLEGRGFVSDEILRDVEVVKRMTIDEKIDFWRRIMAHGKSRNVDFYFVTWNIFTYGTGGKYGITDSVRNAATTDYFRRSVCQMFRTYPDLAGIGLTTGENMPGANFQEKEDWAMATYGQGVLDALKDQPDRRVTFIHRQHQAKVTDIARTFKPLVEHPNIDFIFSFKYAKAHVYSATKQPHHHEFVRELGDMKTIWTLRNDDVFYFRWGAPDFVREFVKNLPRDVSRGYYYGSDQYVWGREFLQRNVDEPRRIEIDKHWYQWLLWGRFAYHPDLDDDRLKAIVAERFGLSAEEGARLFDAWRQVSMIYPITTGFHWGALDFQWYIEGCQSRAGPAENETGFHDVNRFISLKPHPESNCLSIPDYIGNPRQAASSGKRTPPDVAEQLDQCARRSVELLESLSTTPHAELKRTLTDIRIVAHLGRYYADKIRGATELALFRKSQDKNAQQRAIRHLADAARHWRDFATLALQHHRNPLWTNRVGHVDWKKNYQYVLADIRIAGGDPVAIDLPASVDVAAEAVPRSSTADRLLSGENASAPTNAGDLGQFAKWAKIEITLAGPESVGRGAPNPFSLAIEGIFTAPSGRTYTVPGFYDGNGRGGLDGNVWKVRFAADELGRWSFRSRSDHPLLDGHLAAFSVTPPPADAADFFRWGRLEAVAAAENKLRYLKFRDGPYWLKAGCDDPENFLGKYENYDTLDKRKAAIDYLAQRGINSLYIMSHNIDGDDKDVWPWLGKTSREAKINGAGEVRFDVAKLDEWRQLFEYMQRRGLVVYLVLEDDSAWKGFDHARYYREIVARFGYLPALVFNMGEEHNENYKLPEGLALARRLADIDPYDHPRGIHNVNAANNAYIDAPQIDFTAIQTGSPGARRGLDNALQHNQIAIDWLRRCESRGRRLLMVNFDEGRPEQQRAAWWAAYLAGGVWEAHVLEPYDRPMSAWEKTWRELGGARAFMESLPFWEMQPHNELVKAGQALCLAKPGEAYALYLPAGGTVTIDLPADAEYQSAWWNPSNGIRGQFAEGGRVAGGQQSLTAPSQGDWSLRVLGSKP